MYVAQQSHVCIEIPESDQGKIVKYTPSFTPKLFLKKKIKRGKLTTKLTHAKMTMIDM